MSINATEYGIAFNLNANFNLSGATSLLLTFRRPDGTTFTGVPTAPASALVTTDQGIFPANEYARYVFKDGDLNQHGEYFARLTYLDANKRLLSEPISFMVQP